MAKNSPATQAALDKLRIVKRSGESEPFSRDKLERSIQVSVEETGLHRGDEYVDQLVTHVIFRMSARGVESMASDDLRQMVVATMIDSNLAFVARAYIDHKGRVEASQSKAPVYGSGVTVQRLFSQKGTNPLDTVEWVRREVTVCDEQGEPVFTQQDVEVPAHWSQESAETAATYFAGKVGEPGRESSVRGLIERVVKTVADWGRNDGTFKTQEDAEIFENELKAALVEQKLAFHDAAWLNLGVRENPSCADVVINRVEDDTQSIMQLSSSEAMLFKRGAGAGVNLSKMRASCEPISGSYLQSAGPIQFMRGWSAFARAMRPGGKTQRVARLVMLNVDHPDVLDFIRHKLREEQQAWALIDASDNEARGVRDSLPLQNTHHYVRVPQSFMQRLLQDDAYATNARTTGDAVQVHPAEMVLHEMAESAWWCGDPGIQYHHTINDANTCKASGKIHASGPFGAFHFLEDTACVFVSLNLYAFSSPSTLIDIPAFEHAVRLGVLATDIMISSAAYFSPAVEYQTQRYRPLGVSLSNAAGLLMQNGIAYDTDEARNVVATVAGLLTGTSYAYSGELARVFGVFDAYKENAESIKEVLGRQASQAGELGEEGVPKELRQALMGAWKNVHDRLADTGMRHAQATAIVSSKSTAMLLGAHAGGIDPFPYLITPSGRGGEARVHGLVGEALRHLGYNDDQIESIRAHMRRTGSAHGASELKPEHVAVFDCTRTRDESGRTIQYMAHVRMASAVQPLVSGGVSLRVRLPEAATIEDIEYMYREGGRMGVKSLAVRRRGSGSLERFEARSTSSVREMLPVHAPATVAGPRRRRLPDERKSITHKFTVGDHKGYLIVGMHDDGTPGELFVMMNKEGSVISGLVNTLAATTSISLQYGVPLQALVNKFAHMRFEPAGPTNNPDIVEAKSIVDYIFRWMGQKFLTKEAQKQLGILSDKEIAEQADLTVQGADSAVMGGQKGNATSKMAL